MEYTYTKIKVDMKENSKTICLMGTVDFMTVKIDFNMKEFGKIIRKVVRVAFFT